jgi:hypothetical protein
MKKTLMLAAVLLSMGAGAAFAGDGDVNAQPPAQVNAATLQNGGSAHRLFPATNREQVSVYSSFGDTYSRGQQ